MLERDTQYEAFARKWRPRLELDDAELAKAYMRREALDAAGYATLPDEPDKTFIHVRVDGRGLDGSTDPGGIDDMAAEWQRELDGEGVSNHRSFTKDLITHCVGLNRHVEPANAMRLLCAAVWLASDRPDLLWHLRQGNVGLTLDITFDNLRKTRRVKLGLAFP